MAGKVLISHGGGGSMTMRLIDEIFAPKFADACIDDRGDSAVIPFSSRRLAYTTDGHVVSPLFFPGGDIGRLSVCGTVNDLASVGAEPLYMTASFIIEAGIELSLIGNVKRINTEQFAYRQSRIPNRQ